MRGNHGGRSEAFSKESRLTPMGDHIECDGRSIERRNGGGRESG
jgi:hypothetical protein